MREDLSITIDANDLALLVAKRYKCELNPTENGDFKVIGNPVQVAKLHGAVKRAHKVKDVQ